MQIQTVSAKPSFGALRLSYSLAEKLNGKEATPALVKEVKEIKKILRQLGLHKKENVDLYLGKDNNGYYGIISSKKQGTPNNPNAEMRFKKDTAKKLVHWVDGWDYSYSKEALAEMAYYKNLLTKLTK